MDIRLFRAYALLFLRCPCPTSLLGFFYIFEPGSLLRLCWLFTLRNIGLVFRLKYVSLNMPGLCSEGFDHPSGIIGIGN